MRQLKIKLKSESNLLEVIFVDNKNFFRKHKQGYNGIASIKYIKKGEKAEKRLFSPTQVSLSLNNAEGLLGKVRLKRKMIIAKSKHLPGIMLLLRVEFKHINEYRPAKEGHSA